MVIWFVAQNESGLNFHLGNQFLDLSEGKIQKFYVSERAEVLREGEK